MKPTIIDLNSLQLPVQAESFQAVPGGYRLHGDRVSLLHPFGLTKFYRHGFHSWGLASWLDLHRRLDPPTLRGLWPQQDDPSLMEDYPYKSSGLSALQGPDGRILLLGALAPDAQVTAGPELLSGRYALSPNLKHASQPPSDRDWFLAYGEELEVFNRYASLLVEHLGKGRAKLAPRVWCSWYSLYREINEGIINQILASLTGLPFDAFQVDDGWQKSIGDWEANDKFPGGMASLAECIRAAGYLPGLWLAPLIVQPSSRLYQTHPEWVIQDEHGQPALAGDNWGGPFFGLDTTRSEVLDWLEQLIRRVRSWGFGYLKLDFLYGGALAGIRQQDMPREVAYRQGLEVMRTAAGDAYLLACGAPVIASIGLADGMRIGPDVTPFWDNPDRTVSLNDPTGPSTFNAIHTSLHRLWLRPLLHTDPDVAFFRTRYNLMTPSEKALLSDLALIAGFRATSDLPAWLDPDERQSLISFLEAEPKVEQVGRYQFRLDDREVDYRFVEARWPA
jgi:alpha-galactosidase